MPKISVIVPVYKAEKFLATCIESILNQTYGNLEIILVDDGSPDSCGKICEKYALSDSRVKVVHQKNAGVAAARNVGLDLAEGDYVTFVDSDDYIQPQMYEKMIRCAEHNHCDLVMCDCIKVYSDGIHIPNSGVSHARNVGIDASCGEYITFIDADDRIPNNYLENLYETIIESGVDLSICTITKIWHSGKKKKIQLPGSGTFDISELLLNFADYQKKTGIYGYCCGKIILKELVGNIRFDERIKLAEDFDFFLKLYPKVSKICFNDKTEYFYLQESENSSAMVRKNCINTNRCDKCSFDSEIY